MCYGCATPGCPGMSQCGLHECECSIKPPTKPITEYPEGLSFPAFDLMPWDFTKQFGVEDEYEDMPYHEVAKAVKKFATENGYQIYTQVDADNHDGEMYSMGLRFVNRTGVYEVVHIDGLKPNNS